MRKPTPTGFDWQSLAFYTLDLQQSFTPLHSDHESQPLDYHIIESPADSWLAILCDRYPQKQFHLRMIHDCQQCYIATMSGQLAAYAWVTTSSCHVSEINFNLPAGRGRIYIYDCFVGPDFRRRGIYNALLIRILTDYRLPRWPDGYDTAWIAVQPGNTASVRGIRRAGFGEFARVRYVRLGAFTRWYGARNLIERMSGAGTRQILND